MAYAASSSAAGREAPPLEQRFISRTQQQSGGRSTDVDHDELQHRLREIREAAESKCNRKQAKVKRRQEEDKAQAELNAHLLSMIEKQAARIDALESQRIHWQEKLDRIDAFERRLDQLRKGIDGDAMRDAEQRDAHRREINIELARLHQTLNQKIADEFSLLLKQVSATADAINNQLVSVDVKVQTNIAGIESRMRELAPLAAVHELRNTIGRVTAKEIVLVVVSEGERQAQWLPLLLREFNALLPQALFQLLPAGGLQQLRAHQGLALFCSAVGAGRFSPEPDLVDAARGVRHAVFLAVRSTQKPENVPSRVEFGDEKNSAFQSGIFLGDRERERRIVLQWLITIYTATILPQAHTSCAHNMTLNLQLGDIINLIKTS